MPLNTETEATFETIEFRLQKVLNYLKEKADQIKQTDSKETPENGGNYVFLYVCLSVCLFVFLFISLSFCLSFCLSVYLFVFLCLSLCLSAYLFVFLLLGCLFYLVYSVYLWSYLSFLLFIVSLQVTFFFFTSLIFPSRKQKLAKRQTLDRGDADDHHSGCQRISGQVRVG